MRKAQASLRHPPRLKPRLRKRPAALADARRLLAGEVAAVIRRLGLTQAGAALILGADQPKVSRLLNGQIEEFSPERLLTFLTLLGRDVEIVVRRPKMDLAAVGRLRVVSVEEGTA